LFQQNFFQLSSNFFCVTYFVFVIKQKSGTVLPFRISLYTKTNDFNIL